MIQWIGTPDERLEVGTDPDELQALEEQKLDHWIGQIENSLVQLIKDPAYQNLSYVSYADLKSLVPAGNQPLIAVHLPTDSPFESVLPTVKSEEADAVQIEFKTHKGDISLNVIDKTPDTELT